jgi:uncharacterized protein YbaA (DUF1428 family)
MSYIDGAIIPVPTDRKADYIKKAEAIAALFKEYGATAVVDAWGDDVPEGKLTDFRRAVQQTAEETVVFSWVAWPDKAFRDAAWEKVMKDPRMAEIDAPFDGKRMIYGGFQTISD